MSDELTKDEEIISKATQGPWEVHEHHHADGDYWASIGYKGFGPLVDIVGAEGNQTRFYQPIAGQKFLVTPVEEQRANAAFIARSRTRYPALVAEVRQLREALSALYTFPGVRELLAPSGSLGSIADIVEAALARHEEGA